ncbi:MAG: addiction module protein [Algicola sp.]|nr:addiction module protein [Algicola sp.]
MNAQKLIDEVIALPVEERVLIADSILRSITPTTVDVDKAWCKEADKRLKDYHEGKTQPVDVDSVFDKIWQKYE